MIELGNSCLRVTILPELGASIARCEWYDGEEWQPILRPPTASGMVDGALNSALFPMVPFPNRAMSNIVAAAGVSYQIQPNTDEPFALHGTGWERIWRVLAHTRQEARCGLEIAGDYAFDFECEFRVAIDRLTITLYLSIRNSGRSPIPFGLGFYPYFPRLPDTRLQFRVDSIFPEGSDHIPGDPTYVQPEDDYCVASTLPNSWRNNAYGGWDGMACISQPSLGYELVMLTSAGLRELMFYAPPEQHFFALEPQSSLSGETAANRPGRKGLDILEPGCSQGFEAEIRIDPLN